MTSNAPWYEVGLSALCQRKMQFTDLECSKSDLQVFQLAQLNIHLATNQPSARHFHRAPSQKPSGLKIKVSIAAVQMGTVGPGMTGLNLSPALFLIRFYAGNPARPHTPCCDGTQV
jgi:hypothetical protein